MVFRNAFRFLCCFMTSVLTGRRCSVRRLNPALDDYTARRHYMQQMGPDDERAARHVLRYDGRALPEPYMPSPGAT